MRLFTNVASLRFWFMDNFHVLLNGSSFIIVVCVFVGVPMCGYIKVSCLMLTDKIRLVEVQVKC